MVTEVMKAAIVQEAGAVPVYGDFPVPHAADAEAVVTVAASALSQLTRGRASGQHYSSSGAFPFVPGVDGTGRLADGRRVYFLLPRAPYGGMAERTVVAASRCIPIPDDLDDLAAAALANPGMSSAAALVERARFQPGDTVLINGATGASGQLAVQIAKHMGAKKVIATGRDVRALAALESRGADVTIPLTADGDALEASFREQFAAQVDVVLDYIWGPSAERLLIAVAKASPERVPVRFVQIGTASGGTIALPGAILRSSALEMMGSGLDSVPLERLQAAIARVFQMVKPAGLSIATRTLRLSAVAEAWALADRERVVVMPD